MKNKLDNIYNEMNTEYKSTGNIDKEKITQDIESLNKQIENYNKKIQDKQAKIASITNPEGRKKLKALIQKDQKDLKKAEMRKQNLEGFMKYDTQIAKIRDYKNSLSAKIRIYADRKKMGETSIENLNNNLKKTESALSKLREALDPKKTEGMLDSEYYDLKEKLKVAEEKKKQIEEKIAKIKENNEKCDKKVEELKSKVSKCDLAWKTLFTNKDWDEIQRRSIGDNEKLTKAPEKQHIKEAKNQNEKEQVEEQVQKQVEQKIEQTALAPIEKKSIFRRMFNAVKKAAHNVKEYFFPSIEEETPTASKKDVPKIVEEIKENIAKEENTANKNEIEEEKVAEESKTQGKSRDKFLEGLRFEVDEEYKKEIIENKEKAYIEKHKANPSQTHEKEER